MIKLIVFSVFIVGIIISLYLFINVKKKKIKYTRENFAFRSLQLIATTIGTVLTAPYPSDSITRTILKIFFNIDINQKNLNFIYILYWLCSIVAIALLIMYANNVYKNWDGGVSKREHLLLKDREHTLKYFQDCFAYLISIKKTDNELNLYYDWLENTQFKNQVHQESASWHIEVAEMYKIKSVQYRINIQKDWHVNQNCYISNYGPDCEAQSGNIAIYCSIKMPTKEEISRFIQYISLYRNNYFEIIVAVKVKDNSKLEYTFDNIRYVYKHDLLDNLVDFRDYYYNIECLYNKNIIESTNIKIKDIYVEPICSIDFKDAPPVDLNNYVYSWLTTNTTNQHLALLGDYGQGKSVFSLKLTYDLINKGSQRVPILIQLKGKSPRCSNEMEILSYFSTQYGINPCALNILNKYGKLVLIFDGFDEMDLVGSDEIRAAHFQSIWRLVGDKSKLIITGRTNYFFDYEELQKALGCVINNKGTPYCKLLYLNMFNIDQIKKFLKNFDQSFKIEILKAIQHNQGTSFEDLVKRPSNMFLLSQIWDSRHLNSKSKYLTSALIIDEFLASCLERQQEKNLKIKYINLSSIEREYFMIGIALKMYEMDQLVLPKDELKETLNTLIDFFPDALYKYNSCAINLRNGKSIKDFIMVNSDSFEGIITEIRVCGIVVFDENYKGFIFSHNSFYDLLIAKYFLNLISTETNEYTYMCDACKKIYGDLLIRKAQFSQQKMLAELLPNKIKLLNSLNEKENCIYLFKKIFRFMTKKKLCIIPRRIIAKQIRHKTIEKRVPEKIGITKAMRNKVVLTALIIVSLFAGTLCKLLYISLNDKFKIDAVPQIINNNNNMNYKSTPLSWICIIVVIVIFVVLLITTNKASPKENDIALKTWYYCCRNSGISEETILSFVPTKLKQKFVVFVNDWDSSA